MTPRLRHGEEIVIHAPLSDAATMQRHAKFTSAQLHVQTSEGILRSRFLARGREPDRRRSSKMNRWYQAVGAVCVVVAAGGFGLAACGPERPELGSSGAELGSTSLVISQVYGGGGNSGATYKNDFIEIFNKGTTAIT